MSSHKPEARHLCGAGKLHRVAATHHPYDHITADNLGIKPSTNHELANQMRLQDHGELRFTPMHARTVWHSAGSSVEGNALLDASRPAISCQLLRTQTGARAHVLILITDPTKHACALLHTHAPFRSAPEQGAPAAREDEAGGGEGHGPRACGRAQLCRGEREDAALAPVAAAQHGRLIRHAAVGQVRRVGGQDLRAARMGFVGFTFSAIRTPRSPQWLPHSPGASSVTPQSGRSGGWVISLCAQHARV